MKKIIHAIYGEENHLNLKPIESFDIQNQNLINKTIDNKLQFNNNDNNNNKFKINQIKTNKTNFTKASIDTGKNIFNNKFDYLADCVFTAYSQNN